MNPDGKAPDDQFVNPYTFVPFPGAPPRRQPPSGHQGHAELLSGVVHYRLSAETAVLIRGFTDGDRSVLPSRPDAAAGTVHIIPGSAVHGAVRSLHETLVGGCLRIFDPEHVPVYRHAAIPMNTSDVRMAVVREVDDKGQAVSVQLCEAGTPEQRKHWRLDQDKLAALGLLASGTPMRVTTENTEERKVLSAEPDAEGSWVLFISDAGARDPSKLYRAALRPLTDEHVSVPPAVWTTYLAAVDKADDRRPAREHGRAAGDRFEEVKSPKGGTVVGRRYLAATTVTVGQPVWVRVGTDEATGRDTVTELRLAQLWRHQGQGSSRERLPDRGWLPCEDPEALCPSCALFGSAEALGTTRSRAEQRSYRGHLRFSDATAGDGMKTWTVKLPPMGQPRPGAGQFYLVNDRAGQVDQPALREWGSNADKPRLRRLRGRKFYWHTTAANGRIPLRAQARAHHSATMVSEADAFASGTTFTGSITFVDITRAQLGSLLATLEPARILRTPPERTVVHVGGGKPLGFGSCRFHVERDADNGRTSTAWRSATRYGAPAQPLGTFTDIADDLVKEFVDKTPDAVKAVWPAVGIALKLDHVPRGRVWYPPGSYWSERSSGRPKAHQDFDEGYEFWKQTEGLRVESKRGPAKNHPLVPLPEITADSQYLPIVKKQGGGR